MSKVKKTNMVHKKQNEVNKKAIIWTSSIVGAFLILVVLLLIFT
ncbi:hypothetical protein [Paenibacillus albiflavus]|nr:hypothetical protein [Paenibacillus albiflavus]